MSSYPLLFPGVSSSLVFSSFELKPPVSGFQSYSQSSLKTSLSVYHRSENIQVNDEKLLHSEGHPEKFTKLDGEENKEEGDRVGQVKKRGLKEREQACQ